VSTTTAGDSEVKIIRKASEPDTGLPEKEDLYVSAPMSKEIVPDSKTPWATYMNSLNSKYQDRIKKAAQSSNYTLTMRYEDGREERKIFTRMKLLQYQFDEIEDLRAEANELSAAEKPRDSTHKLAEMYKKAAGYILWNVKEERPMTTDEYKHCIFSEVRPALDASMLLGLISDPN
jgi:hypothetical protein